MEYTRNNPISSSGVVTNIDHYHYILLDTVQHKSMIKRIFAGISYGVISYLLGVITTFLLVASKVEQLLAQTGANSGSLVARASRTPEVWQIIMWVFYSEHLVSIKVDSTSALGAVATSGLDQNTFALYGLRFWNPGLFLIPVVTITLIGFIFSYRTPDLDLKSVVGNGIVMSLGYALFGVIGAFFSTYAIIGFRAHPDYAGLPIMATIVLVLSLVGGGLVIPLTDSAN